MARIIVNTNVTLDGVVQDPDGQEGFARGGWFAESGGDDLGAWAELEFEEALRTDALLMGRRTDAWFASRWLSRSGDWADRLNAMPKYVVSTTLEHPVWSNATVLSGDPTDEVAKLKRSLDGEIAIYGSYQLVRALIEHELVDEFRLIVFPVVLGSGERLFSDIAAKKALRLRDLRTIGDSLVFMTYAR